MPRGSSFVTLKHKLIISKQRVSSSVPLQFLEKSTTLSLSNPCLLYSLGQFGHLAECGSCAVWRHDAVKPMTIAHNLLKTERWNHTKWWSTPWMISRYGYNTCTTKLRMIWILWWGWPKTIDWFSSCVHQYLPVLYATLSKTIFLVFIISTNYSLYLYPSFRAKH
jgi:hypothetical protein